jgi:hypothetical protein
VTSGRLLIVKRYGNDAINAQHGTCARYSELACAKLAWSLSVDLAKPEKGQHRQYHDHKADDIDDIVHDDPPRNIAW